MPEAQPKIRVLVVDDHMIVRVGLRTVISEEDDMEVVAEAGDGPGALAAYVEHRPDVTLLDLRMPDVSGAELITQIRRHDPGAKVIVLTSYDADEDIFRAVQAGARGYLLKGTLPDGILEAAIRTVHAGGRHMGPDVAGRLAEHVSAPALTDSAVPISALLSPLATSSSTAISRGVSVGELTRSARRWATSWGISRLPACTVRMACSRMPSGSVPFSR